MYSTVQQTSRDELVNRHSPLVKRIAYHLMSRLPPCVQVDDLIQAGMIGLLEASRNYDPSQGASFETYAGIRIRGAMLDEIRKNDWAPRSVHRKARKVAEAVRQIRFNLAALQERQLAMGTDAGVKGLVLLQTQGVLEVKVADQHQGEGGLTRQVESQEQAHFFERAGRVELSFVEHQGGDEAAQVLEGVFQASQVATAKEAGGLAQFAQEHG